MLLNETLNLTIPGLCKLREFWRLEAALTMAEAIFCLRGDSDLGSDAVIDGGGTVLC